jgi:hypothetical protein
MLLLGVAAAVPIWSVKYLPMVDLPQHAAQIFLWQHYGDPELAPTSRYELNWFTPYLLGYVLVRAISIALPIATAMKVVVTLAIWAFPLSLVALLRQTGGDRHWALAGVPVAFSFSFFWGFLNYLVAVPVGIGFLAGAIAFARTPTLMRGVGVAGFGLVLCVSHVLVCVVCGVSGALLALRGASSPRDVALRIVPFTPAGALCVAWGYVTRTSVADAHMPIQWRFRPVGRLFQLPSMWLGIDFAPSALVAGLLLLVAVLLMARPCRALTAWGAALTVLGAYVVGPFVAFGTFFVAPRFAGLTLPALLLVLKPSGGPRRRLFASVVILLVTIVWLATLTVRFRAFDTDARQLDEVLAHAQGRRSLLSLNFEPSSEHIVRHVPFLHFAAWYQVKDGGELGFSFARFFPELIRYRPGAEPRMTPGLEWFPTRFQWRTDGHFDYFLVRSRHDAADVFLGAAPGAVRLVARSGRWWLYEKTGNQ